MFNRTTSTKFFSLRRSRMKIRISKLEIRNKPKHSNPIIEIRNEIIWNFMLFDHWDLFRFSDFGLLLLFVLGALCPVEYPFHRSVIFSFKALFHGASPVEYRLDQDSVVRPKRYSTGRVIFSRFVILNSTENFKYVWLDPIIGLFLWASTCPRGVRQPATGVALRGLERSDKEVYTTIEGMINMDSRMLFVGEEFPRGFSG